MSDHDMGPSTVAGFNQQCRKCKALDTEIKFALGNRCPVDDAPATSQDGFGFFPIHPVPDLPCVPVDPMVNYKMQVCALQANWFQGYCERQFNHLLQPN